jgi:hypothetical protein
LNFNQAHSRAGEFFYRTGPVQRPCHACARVFRPEHFENRDAQKIRSVCMKVKVCCFVLLLIAFGICQAQALKLTVYTEEFPPFNYTQGNKITGVSTEVVIRVLAKAGIDAEIKSLPWKESFKLAQKLPNTLIYSIARHKKRENLFKWIGIITPSTYSVVALASRTDIRIHRLEDLKGYRIGTTIDDITETWLAGKGFEPFYFIRTTALMFGPYRMPLSIM